MGVKAGKEKRGKAKTREGGGANYLKDKSFGKDPFEKIRKKKRKYIKGWGPDEGGADSQQDPQNLTTLTKWGVHRD